MITCLNFAALICLCLYLLFVYILGVLLGLFSFWLFWVGFSNRWRFHNLQLKPKNEFGIKYMYYGAQQSTSRNIKDMHGYNLWFKRIVLGVQPKCHCHQSQYCQRKKNQSQYLHLLPRVYAIQLKWKNAHSLFMFTQF